MNRNGYAADDIYEPNQYMYGTTAHDQVQKIRLADLPDGARSFAPHRSRGECYNIAVLDWVNGIVEVENIASTTLQAARLVTAEAFELSSHTRRGYEWVDAFQLALDQRQKLDTDEPPVSGLRTF